MPTHLIRKTLLLTFPLIALSACVSDQVNTAFPLMNVNGDADGTLMLSLEQHIMTDGNGGRSIRATATTPGGEFFQGKIVQSSETQESWRIEDSFDTNWKWHKKPKAYAHLCDSHHPSRDCDIDIPPPMEHNYKSDAHAVLIGNRGHNMTCTLHFEYPSIGITGGGVGTCHISDGRKADIFF